jgi:DNA-binding NarL/FixJ family response regulator
MDNASEGWDRAAPLAAGAADDGLLGAAAAALCGVLDGHGATPAQLSSSRMRGVLSPRERDVLRALAAGASQVEMATQLGVKQTTVSAHLMRLYRRLGVSGPDVRPAAIARARRLGLLS